MDIVKRLRQPINEKEDYFISQWPNEEQRTLDAVRFKAAEEIERLQEALRLEMKLRDSALALANDLQNELNRMNGHTWSVSAAIQKKDSE